MAIDKLLSNTCANVVPRMRSRGMLGWDHCQVNKWAVACQMGGCSPKQSENIQPEAPARDHFHHLRNRGAPGSRVRAARRCRRSFQSANASLALSSFGFAPASTIQVAQEVRNERRNQSIKLFGG